MTGAPVPDPSTHPAVMKTMSAPLLSVNTSSLSSAALRPILLTSSTQSTSQFGPTDNCFQLLIWAVWTSVLAAMTSHRRNAFTIIRLMALPPPPPTPITLITAPCAAAVSNENAHKYLHSLIKHVTDHTIRSVNVVFGSCLLSLLAAEFLEHPLRFNLPSIVCRLLVVLEQGCGCTCGCTGRSNWIGLSDARLSSPWTAAWAIISTSVKLPIIQTSTAWGKAGLVNSTWFGTNNFIYTKDFWANSSTPGRIVLHR